VVKPKLHVKRVLTIHYKAKQIPLLACHVQRGISKRGQVNQLALSVQPGHFAMKEVPAKQLSATKTITAQKERQLKSSVLQELTLYPVGLET